MGDIVMIPVGIEAYKICEFLIQHEPKALFTEENNEIIISTWNDPSPQPTEQEIIDAGNDLTTVNGQVFSEWYAEHGGDATLTLRKRASDLLDNVNYNEALIRALAFVILDEINLLRAEHSLADRTQAQLRTAIKAKIAAGDADS
jgi:hypothetical protein